ncbi:hypothetical protein ACMHYC_10705 [Acinetobacter courvalinii]|uniref:hypothetical protein n=1 Tax=Acinetobacter courvalinii TaxID=280147 RepID=UPI0039C96B10
MKNKILIFIIALNLFGCTADQMSKATTTTAMFDNSKNISTREMPAFAKDKWHPSNVFFGARWSDRAPDLIILEVKYMHDFQNLNSLSFNVDGEIFEAKRMNVVTDIERNQYYKASKAPYVITIDQAKKIVNSKNSKFRITTLSGEYTDGAVVLNGDKSMAYKSILNVLKQIS